MKPNWPQIKNLFGTKLGSSVNRFFGTINPIRMHGLAQKSAADSVPGSKIINAYKSAKKHGYGMTDYFQGHTFYYNPVTNMGRTQTYNAEYAAGLARKRIAVAGTMGAYGLSSFAFGPDNAVSNTIGFGTQVGAHTAITAALGRYHSPYSAMAYAGVSAINLARPGSQWGPF